MKEETIKWLTKREMDRLLISVQKHGNQRDLAIFHLSYFLGLRASEVGIIKQKDYNRETGEIYVKRLKKSVSGSRRLDSTRKKVLNTYLQTLRGVIGGVNPEAPLFSSRQQNSIKGIQRGMLHVLMKKYSKKTRLRLEQQHFHVLRHSIGVHLADADYDVKEIKWSLGHQSIKNTEIYYTFTTTQQNRLYSKMELNKQHISG